MIAASVAADHWGWMPGVLPFLFVLRAFLIGQARRVRPGLPRSPEDRTTDPDAGRPWGEDDTDTATPRPTPLRQRWQDAQARYQRTASEYAAFECDALAVLRLPDLVDTTVPATGRFVEAFAEASALATDRQPADDHAEKFVAAAEAAERAWQAARSAAERMRASRFTPEERDTLERTIKLLTVAGDSEHANERHSAYLKARELLAALERRTGWNLPRHAIAELERRVRGELADGQGD